MPIVNLSMVNHMIALVSLRLRVVSVAGTETLSGWASSSSTATCLWKRLCQLLRTFEMFRLYFVQFLVFVNDERVLRPELMRLGCTNSRHSESHVSPGAVHWPSLQFKWHVTCEIPPARYFSACSKALWKLLGLNRPALKTLRMQHFIFSASQLSANYQHWKDYNKAKWSLDPSERSGKDCFTFLVV